MLDAHPPREGYGAVAAREYGFITRDRAHVDLDCRSLQFGLEDCGDEKCGRAQGVAVLGCEVGEART